jgi:hypothetical protein
MRSLGSVAPFAIQQNERSEAIGIGGEENSVGEATKTLVCIGAGFARAILGKLGNALLNDFLGKSVHGILETGRLVDAGAPLVCGRRSFHDARPFARTRALGRRAGGVRSEGSVGLS